MLTRRIAASGGQCALLTLLELHSDDAPDPALEDWQLVALRLWTRATRPAPTRTPPARLPLAAGRSGNPRDQERPGAIDKLYHFIADNSFKEELPDRVLLLPPAMRNRLPGDHLVHLVMGVVADLDLSRIDSGNQLEAHRGDRLWNPRMMVALLFHGYWIGVCSSRRLERATCEDVPFRLLTDDPHPAHSSIARSRKAHLTTLGELSPDILQLCEMAGMVEPGRVALDGTNMRPTEASTRP